MEPFEISLNQVNFEEKDLSPTHQLDSFSNLVSYDEELGASESHGHPVSARKITYSQGGSRPNLLTSQLPLTEDGVLLEEQVHIPHADSHWKVNVAGVDHIVNDKSNFSLLSHLSNSYGGGDLVEASTELPDLASQSSSKTSTTNTYLVDEKTRTAALVAERLRTNSPKDSRLRPHSNGHTQIKSDSIRTPTGKSKTVTFSTEETVSETGKTSNDPLSAQGSQELDVLLSYPTETYVQSGDAYITNTGDRVEVKNHTSEQTRQLSGSDPTDGAVESVNSADCITKDLDQVEKLNQALKFPKRPDPDPASQLISQLQQAGASAETVVGDTVQGLPVGAQHLEVHRLLQLTAAHISEGESNLDAHMADTQGTLGNSKTFRAFTETVEALALQRSVIGNPNIAPASAEEVARAIAAAQRQISHTNKDSDSDHKSEDSGSVVHSELSGSVTGVVQDRQRTYSNDSTKANGKLSFESQTSQASVTVPQLSDTVLKPCKPHAMQGLHDAQSGIDSAQLNSTETKGGKYNTHTENQTTDHQIVVARTPQELIRISAESIVRTKENSSWFSGKRVKVEMSKPARDKRNSSKKKEKKRRKSGDRHQSNTSEGDKVVSVRDSNVIEDHNETGSSVSESSEVSESHGTPTKHTGGGATVARDSGGAHHKKVKWESKTGTEVAHINSEVKSHFEVHGESRQALDQEQRLSEKIEASQENIEYKHQETVEINTSAQLDGKYSPDVTTVGQASQRKMPGKESLNACDSGTEVAGNSETLLSQPPVDASTPIKVQEMHSKSSTVEITQKHTKVKRVVTQEVRDRDVSVSAISVDTTDQGTSMDTSLSDYSTSFSGITNMEHESVKKELERVLKENAKLEGTVEILEVEARTAIKERAQFQAQLATMTTQLKSQESSTQGVMGDRNALKADLETLKQNRARLEQVVIDAHKLLEEKLTEIKSLQEDVKIGQEGQEKLQEKIKEVRSEVKGKESTIQALKDKIAELYVESQTTNQARIQAENDIRSLQNEVKSLMTSKEWYQNQLQVCQNAKLQLQNELTKSKATSIAQGNSIEKLKADNVRIKAHLMELQQKSLQEKEVLARHLEAIEADMMERETLFTQIQQERETMQESLQSHVNEEKSRLSSLTMTSEDQEKELQKARNELKRSTAHVAVLEHEQAELVKRLTLAQESILERDKSLDILEQKYVDTETMHQKTQKELLEKDQETMTMKEEKVKLEVALASAKEEKKVFDEALQTIKSDMGRVEKSFKQMKIDLNIKKEEAERFEKENADLQGEIQKLRLELEEQEMAGTQQSGVSASDVALVQELKTQTASVKNELDSLKLQFSVIESEKVTAITEKNALEQDLVATREKLAELESKLQSTIEERSNLQGQMETNKVDQQDYTMVTEARRDLQNKLAELERESHREIAKQKGKALKLGSDLSRLQKEYKEKQRWYESQISQLTQQVENAVEAKERLEGELDKLQQRFELNLDEQKDHLQKELQIVTTELETIRVHKEKIEIELHTIQQADQSQLEEYKTRTAELEKELETALALNEQQKEQHESNQKLALELEKEKGRLAGIMQSHTTLKQHASVLEAQLAQRESSVAELSTHVQDDLQRKDKVIEDLKKQIKVLEEQVTREKQNVKDAKKQLMTEKGNHIKLKRDTETMRVDYEQLQMDAEQKSTEVQLMQLELSKVQTSEDQYKAEIQRLQADYQAAREEVDQLKAQLNEVSLKDSVVAEQIQSFEWQIQQKMEEIEAIQEQMKLADERNQIEIDNLKKALTAATTEVASLREELSVTRKEKYQLQAKVGELKGGLKASVEHNKVLMGDSPKTDFDISSIEKLLEDTAPPVVKSKPLTFLQACLTGLRGEITSLQQQVDIHTQAVQTSSSSWKELEESVKDLRQICNASNPTAFRTTITTQSKVEVVSPTRLTPEDKTALTQDIEKALAEESHRAVIQEHTETLSVLSEATDS